MSDADRDPSEPADAPRPKSRLVTVSADEAGQRIDNFLGRHLRGVSRPRLYRAIRKGEVRVNKGRTRQTYRVEEGDVVRIPPISAPPSDDASRPSTFDWRPHILDQDKAFLVIDKPSGWAVHGGSGVSAGVIESLRANLPGEHYLELAHRLDRSTSGVLVVARKRSALRGLHAALRESQVEKEYLLLVDGDWQHGEVVIDAPLNVSARQSGERVVRVSPHGQPSQTRFALRDRYGDVSLVSARPTTGRTHQIRVHAAHAGHAILGDDRYGEPSANARAAKLGLDRLALHAAAMAFEWPEGSPRHYSAPMPDALHSFINRLEKRGTRPGKRAKGRQGRR
ncbi:MAG: RluA family pseudouridine synthase [Pseudomonadota bacterium]